MIDREELTAWIGRVHARTYEAVSLLRDDVLAWAPRPGELTAGEIGLHLASGRRLNADLIEGRRPRYRGHALRDGMTAADVRQAVLRSSKKVIAALHSADLTANVARLSGPPAPAWQLVLGGLIEHEVHHRSQLCEYLSALGVEPPPLFGLHAEELPR